MSSAIDLFRRFAASMKQRTYDFTRKLRKGSARTKGEIIDSLKQFARERGTSSFTQKQYDNWKHRALCAAQITKRFGSWASAMEQAELEPMWGFLKSPVEMVETFMDCWEEHDDAPTVKALSSYLKRIGSKYTVHMYSRYFGGVRRLAQRVSDFHLGKISEAQLTERHVRQSNKRRPLPPKLRFDVLTRDNFCCLRCGRSAKIHGVALEIDHRVPVVEGGSDEMDNLETLCKDCNRGKGSSIVATEEQT